MLEVTDLIYILDYGFACYRDKVSEERFQTLSRTYYPAGTKVKVRKHTEEMFTIVLSRSIHPSDIYIYIF